MRRIVDLRGDEFSSEVQGRRHAELVRDGDARVAALKLAAQQAAAAVGVYEAQYLFEWEQSLARLNVCQGRYHYERERLSAELADVGIVLDLADDADAAVTETIPEPALARVTETDDLTEGDCP